jgi:hypothetical protein
MKNLQNIEHAMNAVHGARMQEIQQARAAATAQIELPSLLSGNAVWLALVQSIEEFARIAPQDHDVVVQVHDVIVRLKRISSDRTPLALRALIRLAIAAGSSSISVSLTRELFISRNVMLPGHASSLDSPMTRRPNRVAGRIDLPHPPPDMRVRISRFLAVPIPQLLLSSACAIVPTMKASPTAAVFPHGDLHPISSRPCQAHTRRCTEWRPSSAK